MGSGTRRHLTAVLKRWLLSDSKVRCPRAKAGSARTPLFPRQGKDQTSSLRRLPRSEHALNKSVPGWLRDVDSLFLQHIPDILEPLILRDCERARVAQALQLARRVFHVGFREVLIVAPIVTLRNGAITTEAKVSSLATSVAFVH